MRTRRLQFRQSWTSAGLCLKQSKAELTPSTVRALSLTAFALLWSSLHVFVRVVVVVEGLELTCAGDVLWGACANWFAADQLVEKEFALEQANTQVQQASQVCSSPFCMHVHKLQPTHAPTHTHYRHTS